MLTFRENRLKVIWIEISLDLDSKFVERAANFVS